MQVTTVSIVEDVKEIREALKQIIQGTENFKLLSCYMNAEEAIGNLASDAADIVIMDINLPGLNGIECIRKLKNACPHTLFMMYTVFEDDDKVFEALQAGASSYMLKKTPKEKIVSALIELREGGSPMSTQIARKVIKSFQKNSEPSQVSTILTPKEHEILLLLAKGHLYKEIADCQNIKLNTVKQHIHSIYHKLHVNNRTEAINKLINREK